MSLIENGVCREFKRKVHCRHCRSNPAWRAELSIPDECPHGLTEENVSELRVGGPGTELKLVLKSIGIRAADCSCDSMARRMDKWGGAGCREHMDEIVASLVKEADRRKWMKFIPMKAMWAEELVNRAIEASEKPIS